MKPIKQFPSFLVSNSIGCCGVCAVTFLVVSIPVGLFHFNSAVSFF
ncbi:MAG: hypothetical protein R6U26_03555 [Candidatus Undinarchaeales archaeon]